VGREKFVSQAAAKARAADNRVITFFAADGIPVFLIDVYSKDTQANLSQAKRNEMRRTLTALPRVWRDQQKTKAIQQRRQT
jgi:hypothetical protein